ncbi:MAG TPA: CotH kinase family protein, partial [Kiritimatiellia bacterium]|nr:CotH kinase family protein [Kiritimatiellia bacterium]HRU70352.1 CotH kinase family protein [Kiritimatiellia bacterium]
MGRFSTYLHTMRILVVGVLLCARAFGGVHIAEVLADNENGIRDEDGDREDWIELYNDGDAAVVLDGWWLTDKANNKTQWRVPAVSIAAQGQLLIWASGKNRVDPLQPLHASFSLSKSGEYLGLYRPDPVTGQPLLVDEFAPSFPALPPDVSYGRGRAVNVSTLIPFGSVIRYRVITPAEGAAVYSGTAYASGQVGQGQPGGWNVSPAFNDTPWAAAQMAVGWDNQNKYTYGTSPSGNIKSALYNINTSLLVRKTFTVASPADIAGITLRVRYEDGFVAFINGVEVLRANFSADPLAWNSKSQSAFDKPSAPPEIEITLGATAAGMFMPGPNVLAIQGLNASNTSTDFYLDAELSAISIDQTLVLGYLAEPTPGSDNSSPTAGPLLFNATPEDPNVPRPLGNAASPPLTVTVRAMPTRNPLASVYVYHRKMWDAESAAIQMRDDGVAPDAVAGDGVFSANLPTAGVAPGQMFRWRFEARDTAGSVTKLPAYLDPLDAPQYFGTVARDASTGASQLPVLEWFVSGAPTNGPAATAMRACCYYLNHFYDNIGISGHGQSSTGFPKKSYDFDFTKEKRFLWRDGERRVKDINLLSNYADKTKARNTIAHWLGQQAGTPYHFAFPVRVQLNADFFGVMDMVEDGDDRMLERNGLNPDGALYKIYNTDNVTGSEKKTRKEEGWEDLHALTNGLASWRSADARQVYACDHYDLAAAVNYIAVRFLNSDTDHGHKNFYLYRDTGVTDEWRPMVWDVDLSWGHVFNATGANNPYGVNLGYFDDKLVTTAGFAGGGNVAYKIIYEVPENRLMLMRRIRTLMDRWVQPPGTVNGVFETRLREIAAQIDPDPADPSPWTDGDLDMAKWGIHRYFSTNRPREEVERVITEYLAPRRAHLFNTGSGRVTMNGTTIPDAPQVNAPGMVVIDSLD